MTKRSIAFLSLAALWILPVGAQPPDATKGETPKNRPFPWGDKPTEVGELMPMFDGQTLKGWTPRGGATGDWSS